MSQGWDGTPSGGGWNGASSGGGRDGWASTAAQPPLRRHSQPRHADDVDGESAELGYRVPTGRRPDPSSFDPELTMVSDVVDESSPRRRAAAVDLGIDTYPADDLQPGTRLRVGPRHGSGGRRAEEPAPKSPLRAALGAGGEVIVVLSMALLLSLLIKTFLVQAFFIPSTSMENTLLVGDRVLVSKLTPGVFELHRGDVVVFKDPGGWLTAEQVTPPPDTGGIGGPCATPCRSWAAAAGRRRAPDQASDRGGRRPRQSAATPGPRARQRRPDRRDPLSRPRRRALGQGVRRHRPLRLPLGDGRQPPCRPTPASTGPSTTEWSRSTTSSGRRSSSCGRSTVPVVSGPRPACSRGSPTPVH